MFKSCLLLLASALLLIGAGSGCQTILGTSMADVEKARATADVKTVSAPADTVFQTLLGAADENKLLVFVKNPAARTLLLMNIPGSIDTTEVGVFVTETKPGESKVEVSSRAPFAKDTASKLLFKALDTRFPPPAAPAAAGTATTPAK